MKKREERGITLIAFILIIVAVLIIAFGTIYYIFSIPKTNTPIEEMTTEQISKLTTEEKIEANKWDAQIISDVTEQNIPVPQGYTYVQGNKDTGLIVKNSQTETKYLFIPYQENINEETSEYYKNVKNYEMETDVLQSIKKYNGFFVNLNSNMSIENLKTIENEEYQFQAEQMYLQFSNDDSVNSHILYPEELAQIKHYLNNNNVDIGDNTIGAQALIIESYSTVNIDTSTDLGKIETKTKEEGIVKTSSLNIQQLAATKVSSASSKGYVYMYTTSSDLYENKQIPIPSGFKYSENDGIVSIQDEENKNLIYIWVPLTQEMLNSSSNSAAKKQLWTKVYEKYEQELDIEWNTDSALYQILKSSKESYTTEFKNSIKQYNGFYISEAELGYDDSKEYYNKARGMVDYSVTGTVNGGDYYRGTNSKSSTYKKMKQLAEDVADDKVSVKSHLTYGAELDSALLWIANTNKNYKDSEGNSIVKILAGDSTYVGKYSNSNLGATSKASDVKSFNGIWGLGGNLAEVTQEEYEDKKVLRGGSYETKGGNAPIASRIATDNIKQDSTGFRTSLYIIPGLKRTTTKSDKYTKEDDEDDTVINEYNVDFNLCSNLSRWTNRWEVKLYKKPDINSTPKAILGLGEEVVVTATAKKLITTSDNKTIAWARVDTDEGKNLYINAQEITDCLVTLGDNVDFVKGENATRYHNTGLKIYDEPSSSKQPIHTKSYVGAVQVVGKSTDGKWAMILVDGVNRFVRANDLLDEADTEKINNINFVQGDINKRYVSENVSAATLYSVPFEGNISNDEKTKYAVENLKSGTEINICGISEDNVWVKLTHNGQYSYTYTKWLDLENTNLDDIGDSSRPEMIISYSDSSLLDKGYTSTRYDGRNAITSDDSMVFTIVISTPNSTLKSVKINNVENNNWTEYNHELVLGGVTIENTGSWYAFSYTAFESGQYTIEVTDTDGKSTKKTFSVCIDQKGPDAYMCRSFIQGNYQRVYIAARDEFSNIKRKVWVYYAENGTEQEEPIKINDNSLIITDYSSETYGQGTKLIKFELDNSVQVTKIRIFDEIGNYSDYIPNT